MYTFLDGVVDTLLKNVSGLRINTIKPEERFAKLAEVVKALLKLKFKCHFCISSWNGIHSTKLVFDKEGCADIKISSSLALRINNILIKEEYFHIILKHKQFFFKTNRDDHHKILQSLVKINSIKKQRLYLKSLEVLNQL